MVQVDKTNLRLLEVLQNDARTSIADLARTVRLAESSVRDRIISLERNNILRGYRAKVDFQKLGYSTHALIRADCSLANLGEISKGLAAIPNITSAIMTTGAKPLLLELWVEDLPRLEKVMETRIMNLPLTSVESAVVLNTMVEPRPLSLAVEPTPTPLTPASPRAALAYEEPPTTSRPIPLAGRPLLRQYA
jgi:Lrp/AsnC family transcriptional regulator, leucine-responsive regulatory protein